VKFEATSGVPKWEGDRKKGRRGMEGGGEFFTLKAAAGRKSMVVLTIREVIREGRQGERQE